MAEHLWVGTLGDGMEHTSSQFIIQPVAAINESITPGCKHIIVLFLHPMSSALSSHLFIWQKIKSLLFFKPFSSIESYKNHRLTLSQELWGRGPYLVLGWTLTSFPLICLPKVAADCGYSGGQDCGE